MSGEWKDSLAEVVNSFIFTSEIPSTKQAIKFKPIDTRTLKKLLVYEKSEDFAVVESLLDDIISNCVVDPSPVDLDSMYIYDRAFLLFEIRRMSKGESIENTWKCPECESMSVQYLNFDAFPFVPFVEPTEKNVSLSDRVSLELKHFTRGDQREVNAKIQNMPVSKEIKLTESMFNMLASSINAYLVDGKRYELTLDEKIEVLEKMPDTIMEKIKDWHVKNRFGYDIQFTFLCPHCGNKVVQKQDVLQNA